MSRCRTASVGVGPDAADQPEAEPAIGQPQQERVPAADLERALEEELERLEMERIMSRLKYSLGLVALHAWLVWDAMVPFWG